MTMVPSAETLSKHQHQHQQRLLFCAGVGYGGCGGTASFDTAESFGGLMSRLEGTTYDRNQFCVNSEEEEQEEEEACLGSDLEVTPPNYQNQNRNPMADQDDSRTNSLNEAGGEGSSCSKEEEREEDQGWLQLSIGGGGARNNATTSSSTTANHDRVMLMDPAARRMSGGLIELDLLPAASIGLHQTGRATPLMSAPIFHVPEFRAPSPRPAVMAANFSTSLFFQHHTPGSSSSVYAPPSPPPPSFLHHHQQPEISWAFRPVPHNIIAPPNLATCSTTNSSATSSPSSSSLMPQLGPYFSRPFQVHSGLLDVAGPSSSDLRIIDRPRRPHSGIWFMLQASQNQAKEPFLPQISKTFLRIKDGRMTVRVLMKYLVNKLRLDSESEVEITCRGQQVEASLTLQHVRDEIWSPRDAVTLLPDSSTTDHVMVLQYGRSA